MQTDQQSPDRRGVYRVKPPPRPVMACQLARGDGTQHKVSIVDISASGAAVRIAGAAVPVEQGERLTLQAQSLSTDERLSLACRALAVREQDASRVLCLEFLGGAELDDNAHAALLGLFNRRARRRSRTAIDSRPVTAEAAVAAEAAAASSPDVSVSLVITNLSPGGLCARTDTQGHARLADASRLQLRLSVAETADSLTLPALVRYRAVDDEGVLYGLEFEREVDRQKLFQVAGPAAGEGGLQ